MYSQRVPYSTTMQDINIVVDYMGPWTYEGTRIYTDKRKEQKVEGKCDISNIKKT